MLNLLDIQWKVFGTVLGVFFAIAFVFTILILIVTKICRVEEDKKVAAILERLGGSNCGGCGCSGCAAFAQKLAEGKGDVHDCHATTKENAKQIASILGVEFADEEPTMAVVKCAGGVDAKDKFHFVGYTDCSTIAATFQGGQKACSFACLGGGDCKAKCPHNAIKIADGVSAVDKTRCTSCGACINACPKKIIERIPRSAPVYVACSSECKGKDVMNVCTKGCIGCAICAKSCPHGAISMKDNLPVFDYKKCTGCKTCVAKCPRKIIREI